MKLKKIVVSVITAVSIVGTTVACAFSDVNSSHWAYNQVELMQEKGVISGFEDGTFRPDMAVTREQFASILVKTLKLNNIGKSVIFEDVEGERWSKSAIDTASSYLTGYEIDGKYYFRPNEAAVREDMAVAVVKARGLESEEPDYTVLDKFSDKELISEGVKKYVAIAVEHGIMSGNANGTFNPLGGLTRAEITALMCNVMEKVAINEIIGNDEIKEISVKVGDTWYTTDSKLNTAHWLFMKPDEEYKLETKVNGELTSEGLEFEVEANPHGIKISKNGVISTEEIGVAHAYVRAENGLEIKFSIWIEGEINNNEEEGIKEISVKVGDTWYTTDSNLNTAHWLFLEPGETYKLETKVNGVLMNEGLKFDIEANPWGTEISKKGIITTDGEGATHGTVRAENGLEIKFGIWVQGEEKHEEKLPEFEIDEEEMMLDLGENWAKYQVTYGISSPGQWYTPMLADGVTSYLMPMREEGKIYLEDAIPQEAKKIYVRAKENEELGYTTLNVPESFADMEIERLPIFEIDEKTLRLDFGDKYEKYEVSYSFNKNPGIWYKVKEDFNNPHTIVTEGTKLMIKELIQADNINYVFVRLEGKPYMAYQTIKVPDYKEELPEFEMEDDGSIYLGEDWDKYEFTYDARYPWYTPNTNTKPNNASYAVLKGETLYVDDYMLEHASCIYIREKDNLDLGERKVLIPEALKTKAYQLKVEVDGGEAEIRVRSEDDKEGIWNSKGYSNKISNIAYLKPGTEFTVAINTAGMEGVKSVGINKSESTIDCDDLDILTPGMIYKFTMPKEDVELKFEIRK